MNVDFLFDMFIWSVCYFICPTVVSNSTPILANQDVYFAHIYATNLARCLPRIYLPHRT